MNAAFDEKALRKAWLKNKFASWEYHEELLALHDEYLSGLHRHWNDVDRRQRHPGFYRTMVSPVFLNFDKVQKPGEISRSDWNRKPTVGWADAITYNFNRGLGDFGPEFDEWVEVPDIERARFNELVKQMLTCCQNITTTVDDRWTYKGSDNALLDESYTGPIVWPTDWREDLLGSQGSALASTSGIRIAAGAPAPSSGLWQAIDPSARQQRVDAGSLLPDLKSAYGLTVWQRISD
jgi:hypothetical protein